MTTLEDLLALGRPALAAVLRAGHDIDPEALADREFHGVSLGLPRVVERLTWKKFKKVFVSGEAGLTGYNEAVEQNGLAAPWVSKRNAGRPVRYGHYRVRTSPDPHAPSDFTRGLLIDYGPDNPMPPMRFIRDPLVAVNPGSAELLLGVSYLDLGPLKTVLPTYFALTPGAPIPRG